MEDKTTLGDGQLNQEINEWACECLSSLGYTLKSKLPENIVNTAWSCVLRFESSSGYIYLKHTPNLLALEATIIEILRDQFHASVPIVIAHNTKLNCFLMKDAGKSLREILKQQFDVELLCKAIDQFTSLQLATAEQVNVFIDIGVPDWRLDKLPDLYKELLLKKDILIEDGLTEIEISELEKLFPKVTYLCQKLSDYSIKQSIVQPDFNDNNTLIDDKSKNITMIDLGEIAISHPFFSLINCLHLIKKHHALTTEDDAYLRIKDACLKNYMNCESEENVSNAFATAHVLWFVYGLLANERLIQACDKEKLMSFQGGKLSSSLREFMAICKSIDLPLRK